MTLTTIVSYDGTAGDRDALNLARVFDGLGASTLLTYVRHSHGDAQSTQDMLDRGAAEFGNAQTRVVTHPSTSEGLKALAATENAGLLVFGSEYRTPANRIGFQKTTQNLLDGGRTAIAIAPAGYTQRPIKSIGLLAGLDDHAAIDTAHAIASHFGATVSDSIRGIDLLIVGSRVEAGEGKVLLSARNEITIEEEARVPVLVLTRGVALDFRTPLAVA
jgi:hypothetical protein